jgi:type VI secretion system protein
MPDERLLERIRRAEDDPEHRGAPDPARVVGSILHHLRKLLNTRQGNVLIAGDYGIPDFTDLATTFTPESLGELGGAIARVIEKYEPRLAQLRVTPEPEGLELLELHFRIRATLTMNDGRKVPVAFRTVVAPDGKVAVER